MVLEVVNPLQYPGWDGLLLSHPDHSIFHTTDWARVLIDSYGFTPHYLLETEGDKIITVLPLMEIRNIGTGNRGVSLPFSDYCDPLLSDSIRIQEVLENAIAYGKRRGWTSLEIRSRKEMPGEISPLGSYLHHELKISEGGKPLFSRFRESTRRNINKADREGVEVIFRDSMEAVERYFALHCGTRKMHGLPPQPFSFFQNVQKHILSKGKGFVALARYQGKSIAGGIYMHFGGKAIFKYGASDRRYLEVRANNMVMWEAIRFYSQNGFNSFSFGRTDPENEGLAAYKRGWGSDETKISILKYDMKNSQYINTKKRTYGIHNKIIKHLPFGISKFLGRSIYQFMD